jgi:hypothetical protein
MNEHLFCVDNAVWQALTKEEISATIEGLKELNLYKLPHDGPLIILRLIFTSHHYVEIGLLAADKGDNK